MKSRIKGRFAYYSLLFLGYSLCVIPPTVATLTYFPLFRSVGGGAVIAGGTALLLILSIQPLWQRGLKLLSSGTVFLPWLLLFLLFSGLAKIADEMTVISFVGLLSNLLGAGVLRLSGGIRRKRDE